MPRHLAGLRTSLSAFVDRPVQIGKAGILESMLVSDPSRGMAIGFRNDGYSFLKATRLGASEDRPVAGVTGESPFLTDYEMHRVRFLSLPLISGFPRAVPRGVCL